MTQCHSRRGRWNFCYTAGMKEALFALAKSPLGELIVGIAFGTFSKLLPVRRVRETDKVLALWHPKPYWEYHILIVPKKAIKNISALQPGDFEYVAEVYRVAQEIVKERGWQESDYTIVTNGGTRQEVAQLHFHLGSGEVRR